jgi:hypothetical protein
MINKYGENLDCFKAKQGEVVRLTRDVVKNCLENCLLIARPFDESGNCHGSYLRASKDGTEKGVSNGDHYTLLCENEYECTGIMYDKHPDFQHLVDYKDYIISSIIPQPEKIGLYQEGFLFPHGSVVKLKKDIKPYKAGDILYYSCFGKSYSHSPGYARISKNNFDEYFYEKSLAISNQDSVNLELVQAAVCKSSSTSDIKELANKFLQEAKERYPVGTKYIHCQGGTECKVTKGDFSIHSISSTEFSIYSDPGKGVLYNSKLDKWAQIITPPIESSKEIPNPPSDNVTEVIFYDPAEIKKVESSLQELADKVNNAFENKAFENKSVEDVYLKKQKRKLDTTITPVSSVSV